jgi:lysozyme
VAKFFIIGAGLLAGIAALIACYFLGIWMPNFPSTTRYPVRGIDVSHHQGEIDWQKVAASGIKFVYVKASEGRNFQDPSFWNNLSGASRAGLYCGAYHYFTLDGAGSAQAQNFIRSVPKGSTFLPPAIDLETWGNSAKRPAVPAFQAELNAMMKDLRDTYGMEPIIYSSSGFLHNYLKDYPVKELWYRAVFWNPSLGGFDNWNFWQFTEKARVPGIQGFVDMDVFHGGPDDFAAWEQEGKIKP